MMCTDLDICVAMCTDVYSFAHTCVLMWAANGNHNNNNNIIDTAQEIITRRMILQIIITLYNITGRVPCKKCFQDFCHERAVSYMIGRFKKLESHSGKILDFLKYLSTVAQAARIVVGRPRRCGTSSGRVTSSGPWQTSQESGSAMTTLLSGLDRIEVDHHTVVPSNRC